MAIQEKIAAAIAAIAHANAVKADAADASSVATRNTTAAIREAAKTAHAEGLSVKQAAAQFAAQVTYAEQMDETVKVNKVFSAGFKGFVNMLHDGVNIDQFTDKGDPATVQHAVAYIASDDVKALNAAKSRFMKILKVIIKAAGKNKRKQADAINAVCDALDSVMKGETESVEAESVEVEALAA